MSRPSSALAFLIANYTDSEGEEDAVEDDNKKSPTDDSSTNSSTPNIPSPMPVIRPRSVGNEGDSPDDVHLPPEPTGLCSPTLQNKISRLYEKMISSGLDMNQEIEQRKNFRNPYMYEKLVDFCDIYELGTNYPTEVYDPSRYEKEPSYEELAHCQNSEMDRRMKVRKDKTKVEFVSCTVKHPVSGSGAEDGSKQRKSKWDQVGTMAAANVAGGTQAGHVLKPAGLLQQPSLTTSVTGTKGKNTSASGSIPKKPRI
jgi:hypothetical protein